MVHDFFIVKRFLFLAEQGYPHHSFSDGGSLVQNVCAWPAAATCPVEVLTKSEALCEDASAVN